mmetsp:Transcript_24959/g.65516  ORF Transcript_24959/g.65516 Transcript_24959/m.65516 type:complete len:94 (+) Transcript_24959:47-328(+)
MAVHPQMPIRSPTVQQGGVTGRAGPGQHAGARTPVQGAAKVAKAAGAPTKHGAQSKPAASQANRASDVITNAPKVPAHICMGTVRESAAKMGF